MENRLISNRDKANENSLDKPMFTVPNAQPEPCLLYTSIAGNQTEIPGSIFEGVRTLTANIVLEMGYAADLHREALIATAVVLFVFILLINLLLSLFRGRKEA